MRIALFTDTFPPEINGVAMTLARLKEALEARGIPVLVVAPDYPATDAPFDRSVERNMSVPFWLYPEIRLAVPRPFALKKTLDAFRPTLCHLATPANLGLFGRAYCLRRKIPIVASYHTHLDRYLDYYGLGWLLPVLTEYMKWFHRPCRMIYAPSEETIRHLERLGLGPNALFGRGVDTGRFHPRPPEQVHAVRRRLGVREGETLFLYVGRLAREKDLDVLADAVRGLSDDVLRRSRFVLVGDGPHAEEIKNRFAGLPVVFPGFLRGEALAEAYAAADWFVFPSSTETFGNVALEALASGVPVIGSAAGGVTSFLEDGQNALLVPPRDPVAFRQALETAHRRPALRRRLAEGALKIARSRSWDAIFDRLIASYRAVLQETGVAAGP
ncbi:MAG: glycosyltransferase family 1 protein [Hydrogenibacillus schlegelii]|uniref:Glycosyltransferase family 1 protein n=1 Tax=Hydrogenibacillus schlegelii TaxID=1484 RepID=A0A947CZ06_HYDSH|nr:glycosyltransferase family 1 protein [Hydrogenibacillus schlegelii]